MQDKTASKLVFAFPFLVSLSHSYLFSLSSNVQVWVHSVSFGNSNILTGIGKLGPGFQVACC